MQRFGTVARTMNGAKGTNNFLLVGFKKLTDGNRLSGQTCWIGSVLVASSWPLISVWSKDSAEVAAEVVDSPESDKCCWRSESVLAISICSSSAAKIRNSSSSLLLTERVNEFNVKYVDFLSIHDKDSNYNSEKKKNWKNYAELLTCCKCLTFFCQPEGSFLDAITPCQGDHAVFQAVTKFHKRVFHKPRWDF